MNGIIWLASYPKSGNTWFRVFLTNLLRDTVTPASINNLVGNLIASSREFFDDLVGIEASDLTTDEIERLRPELYCHLAETTEKQIFVKTHDAYTEVASGQPLIPAAATAGAICFVRNPLDVAVSFARHSGWNYDTTIANMARENFSLYGKTDRLHNQLRQKLLSWSSHVLSWVNLAPFPVCLLRYEDMKTRPCETFTRAVRFIGLPHTTEQIQKALTFSSFDILRKQEETDGFGEKCALSDRFFRKGESGSWREELCDEQVQRIMRDHGVVMRRFGYLDEHGEIAE